MLRFLLQANARQQRKCDLLRFGGAFAVNVAQREGDILKRGEVSVEVELLENKANMAAQLTQLTASELAGGLTINKNLAAAEIFELVDQADQRRFPGAGRAAHRHHFSRRNL